jgi:hypothetical protein
MISPALCPSLTRVTIEPAHLSEDHLPARITAVAARWPVPDHDRCAARVRQIQNAHMDGNGWNDIGYSALVCPHSYVFVGRGPHVLPAANGAGLNSGHYPVCGLVGDKGLTRPTNAMLSGIRDAIEWLRRKGDAGTEIKGHRDGYPTDCPGGPLYAWVKKGAPRPDQEDDDVPDYVSVGIAAEQQLPPNKWITVTWGEEHADSTHQHKNEGGPSILHGSAKYSLTASLTLRGLPAGTEGRVRAVEVDAGDTARFDSSPVQEFTATSGDTTLLYALPADTLGPDRWLRVQVFQSGTGTGTGSVVSGSAKVLFWR